ncbi:MAG: hypothetical protein ACD_75C01143G0009 [uncultured bacterium]|nr:MAG: hypothetical protein ACD_75C01143G0009 [uncultured bacterium]
MDYSPFLTSFLQHFWWVIPFAIIAGIIKSPRGKGIFGEILVKLIAKIRFRSQAKRSVFGLTRTRCLLGTGEKIKGESSNRSLAQL